MADEIDRQIERDAILDKVKTDKIRQNAASIPVGYPGKCEYCGHDSKRLVNGACAPCRDKYRLP